MDIIVFYGRQEFIVELKTWRGPKRHREGLAQLLSYMESRNQQKGWLVTFCFLHSRVKTIEEYTRTVACADEREIYSVVV